MNILVFGASGSAGGSVVRACLASPGVTSVRAITRRPLSLASPKLQAVVHRDYRDYTAVADAFLDLDACFFCLGISVTQVSGEAEYREITHDYTLAAAAALHRRSPSAAFHYISGQGTSANSRFMWARVKAETERELIARHDAVCWRPAAIDGEPSASSPRVYEFVRPLFRLLRPFRGLYIDGTDLGVAMLQGTAEHIRGRVIENREIRDIADRGWPLAGA
jgi:uncharacterized protein YbjT (DUF2867 family)